MKKRNGFTLIELLVVIAIIALLLSIIMPGLSAVKERAKKVVCMAHMKGIGDAVLIYTQQQDGELPQPLDGSLILKSNYNPSAKDLGQEGGTDYYTYAAPPRGVSGLGYLYKAGLMESDTDLPFCPSMKQLFGINQKSSDWNPHGNISHWNYIGQPGGTNVLEPKDYHIDWMPTRVTVGIRKLYHYGDKRGYRKIEDASMRGKRAFLCDLWVSYGYGGSYWKTRETDIPHKTGQQTSLNTWYIDGHGESVKLGSDMFERYESTDDAFLLKTATWSKMLD